VSGLNASQNTNYFQMFMVFLSLSRIVPQIRPQPITACSFLFIIYLSFDAV
jgi:hypothetical protein